MLDVTAALYSHGTLLLAESSGPDAKATKLLLAARNYTLPPPTVNTSTASQSIWLREVVSDLSQLVPGGAGGGWGNGMQGVCGEELCWSKASEVTLGSWLAGYA